MSPEQIHFPNLYFICPGYLIFLTTGGLQGQSQLSAQLSPVSEFLSVYRKPPKYTHPHPHAYSYLGLHLR